MLETSFWHVRALTPTGTTRVQSGRRRRVVWLVAALGVMLFSACGTGFRNASFETASSASDPAPGWAASGGSTLQRTTDAIVGAHALRISGPAGAAASAQATFGAGHNVVALGLWVRPCWGTSVQLEFEANGRTLRTNQHSGAPAWQFLVTRLDVAVSGVAIVRVRLITEGCADIDGVQAAQADSRPPGLGYP